MNIAICGAGLAGATLAYLFKRRNIRFEVYDIPRTLPCGLGTPCGFGVNRRDFFDVCEYLRLSASKYILRHEAFGFLDGLKIRADMAAIDKPRLVHDLLGDTQVNYNPPEDAAVIIDATGVARAYSPPAPNDFKVWTVQRRVKLSRPAVPSMYWSSKIGYAWLIPLSADGLEAHLGAGAIHTDDQQDEMERLVERLGIDVTSVICGCRAQVRVSGPILPMVDRRVITIGEAAGLVSPLSGGGNIPGMVSALSLASHWGNPSQYQAEMVQRFGYFCTEAGVLKSLAAGRLFRLQNIVAIRRMLHFVGIYPTPTEYFGIIGNLRRLIRKG